MGALTLTQQHWTHAKKQSIWKKLAFFYDTISPRYTPKLKRTNFSTLNSYKNRRSRSRWNLVETMLKTQEEHRNKFHCPIRHPSRDITKNRFHICQVFSTKNGENSISAMPRAISRFSIWNFNVVFGPHVPKNWKPAFFFIRFIRQVMVAFVFFGSLFWSYL